MVFSYKPEIVKDIVDSVSELTQNISFEEIKLKYSLNEQYLEIYLLYCISKNYIRKRNVKSDVIGSNKNYFVGYEITPTGEKLLYGK